MDLHLKSRWTPLLLPRWVVLRSRYEGVCIVYTPLELLAWMACNQESHRGDDTVVRERKSSPRSDSPMSCLRPDTERGRRLLISVLRSCFATARRDVVSDACSSATLGTRRMRYGLGTQPLRKALLTELHGGSQKRQHFRQESRCWSRRGTPSMHWSSRFSRHTAEPTLHSGRMDIY